MVRVIAGQQIVAVAAVIELHLRQTNRRRSIEPGNMGTRPRVVHSTLDGVKSVQLERVERAHLVLDKGASRSGQQADRHLLLLNLLEDSVGLGIPDDHANVAWFHC